jgi:hypothetical protein
MPPSMFKVALTHPRMSIMLDDGPGWYCKRNDTDRGDQHGGHRTRARHAEHPHVGNPESIRRNGTADQDRGQAVLSSESPTGSGVMR